MLSSTPSPAFAPFSCIFTYCNCSSHFPRVCRNNNRTPLILRPYLIVVCPPTKGLGIDAALHHGVSAPILHIFPTWALGLQRRRYASQCPLHRPPALPARSDGVGNDQLRRSATTGSLRRQRRPQTPYFFAHAIALKFCRPRPAG